MDVRVNVGPKPIGEEGDQDQQHKRGENCEASTHRATQLSARFRWVGQTQSEKGRADDREEVDGSHRVNGKSFGLHPTT